MWNDAFRIDKQFLKWAWLWSRDIFKFGEIIDNISEVVQYRDIVTMEDWQEIMYMAIEWQDCQWP